MMLLHQKRKEKGAVSNRSHMEAEAETWGLLAGVGIGHINKY